MFRYVALYQPKKTPSLVPGLWYFGGPGRLIALELSIGLAVTAVKRMVDHWKIE